MANELTLNAKFNYSKGSTSHVVNMDGTTVDVSGTMSMHGRQSIGTSEEAVDIGEVTAGGYMVVVNRDATNFVELRPGSGLADLIKIKAGEVALFRLASTATLFAIADTAACDIEYAILDD